MVLDSLDGFQAASRLFCRFLIWLYLTCNLWLLIIFFLLLLSWHSVTGTWLKENNILTLYDKLYVSYRVEDAKVLTPLTSHFTFTFTSLKKKNISKRMKQGVRWFIATCTNIRVNTVCNTKRVCIILSQCLVWPPLFFSANLNFIRPAFMSFF